MSNPNDNKKAPAIPSPLTEYLKMRTEQTIKLMGLTRGVMARGQVLLNSCGLADISGSTKDLKLK